MLWPRLTKWQIFIGFPWHSSPSIVVRFDFINFQNRRNLPFTFKVSFDDCKVWRHGDKAISPIESIKKIRMFVQANKYRFHVPRIWSGLFSCNLVTVKGVLFLVVVICRAFRKSRNWVLRLDSNQIKVGVQYCFVTSSPAISVGSRQNSKCYFCTFLSCAGEGFGLVISIVWLLFGIVP